jgi:hypothetical protein
LHSCNISGKKPPFAASSALCSSQQMHGQTDDKNKNAPQENVAARIEELLEAVKQVHFV